MKINHMLTTFTEQIELFQIINMLKNIKISVCKNSIELHIKKELLIKELVHHIMYFEMKQIIYTIHKIKILY